MSAIRGTYRNGRVELTDPPPADWKDGDTMQIEPIDPPVDDLGILGDDPESIEKWCTYLEALAPLRMNDEEVTDFRDVLAANRAAYAARREERRKQIEGMFE